LGSVYVLTDNDGNVVEAYHYDIYGAPKVYAPDGTPRNLTNYDNHILFTSREYVWQLGLYYYRARWYCPMTGQFCSFDPAFIVRRERTYVQNRSTMFLYPTGLLIDRDYVGTLEGLLNEVSKVIQELAREKNTSCEYLQIQEVLHILQNKLKKGSFKNRYIWTRKMG